MAAFATVNNSIWEIETMIKVVQPLILVTLGEPNASLAKVIAATKKVVNAECAGM